MYAIRWNQTKNKMESRHEQGCEIGDPFDACNFSEENAKRTVAKKIALCCAPPRGARGAGDVPRR
jgi:hypothetical protein